MPEKGCGSVACCKVVITENVSLCECVTVKLSRSVHVTVGGIMGPYH